MSAIRGQRWGWNQLDSRWARRVVLDAGVVPGDLVLDVAAGTGAMTHALVGAGARLLAIELDPQRAASLSRLPRRPFKVVSNLPFGITTSLVKRLISPGSRLIRAELLVPWHAA